MAYTFTADQTPASRCRVQWHFETAGHRGIYADGSSRLTSQAPYSRTINGSCTCLGNDFSECHDLAEDKPELCLGSRWTHGGKRRGESNVLPLDDRMQGPGSTPATLPTQRSRYESVFPARGCRRASLDLNFTGRTFKVTAEVERSGPGDEGVLLAHGRRAAGFSLFVQQRPTRFRLQHGGPARGR